LLSIALILNQVIYKYLCSSLIRNKILKDMKEHAIFIGKVVIAVIVGMMIYDYVKKNMAAKSTKVVGPAPISTPVVTDTPA